jgi:hypothetical protein
MVPFRVHPYFFPGFLTENLEDEKRNGFPTENFGNDLYFGFPTENFGDDVGVRKNRG